MLILKIAGFLITVLIVASIIYYVLLIAVRGK